MDYIIQNFSMSILQRVVINDMLLDPLTLYNTTMWCNWYPCFKQENST